MIEFDAASEVDLLVAVVDAEEEEEDVVERLDVECGRGESGVSGERELSEEAGEEDMEDSVSAVDNNASPNIPAEPPPECRLGLAQRESDWLLRAGLAV